MIETDRNEPETAKHPDVLSSRGGIIVRHWDWIALGLVLVLIGIIRVRLLSIPLERDEGEYAYMGQLLLKGIPPYKLAYSMKFPGAYIAYAAIMGLFGQTIRGIHLGLLVVNAISTVLVFLLGKRVLGRTGAFVAGATFGLMSVHRAVLGTFAHATQFVAPLVLGAVLLLTRKTDSARPGRLVLTGVLLGGAVLVKQHAAFYVLFAILYHIRAVLKERPGNWKQAFAGSGLILLGTALPFAATCVWLYAAGVFSDFWSWTVRYARQYVSGMTVHQAVGGLRTVWVMGLNLTVPLLALAGIGLVAVWWDKGVRAKAGFLTWFFVVSLLTVCPGGYFRPHYFVLVLPAVGLLCGVAVSAVTGRLLGSNVPRWAKAMPMVVFAGAWLSVLLISGDFFFRMAPISACREVYRLSPFPEAIEVADYIRKHSTKDDSIFVFGSEPEIYFYSQRRSASGFIYLYNLTEKDGRFGPEFRRRLFRDLETKKPKFIVFVSLVSSWCYDDKGGNIEVFTWGSEFSSAHYVPVGCIDLLGMDYWPEAWGADEMDSYVPGSDYFISVFERRPE